jgi:hypothetical protein
MYKDVKKQEYEYKMINHHSKLQYQRQIDTAKKQFLVEKIMAKKEKAREVVETREKMTLMARST